MRLTRFLDDQGRCHTGVDLGDGFAAVSPPDSPSSSHVRPALGSGGGPPSKPPMGDPDGPRLAIAQRLAPIDPPAIYCIGLNYAGHAGETGATLPERPVVFMKPPSAVSHDGAPIRIPACCTHGPEVDYEVELAVVIGTEARDVPEDRALDYVHGYTVGNDVSARHWQKRLGGGQWVRGKSFDTFCPLGPVLVTADQLPDPQNLRLTTTVNGQTRQDSTTADMIFPVARLIAFLSMDTTLYPGTVILTGTPEGVGMGHEPPCYLAPGDQVAVEIESIGRMTNPVA